MELQLLLLAAMAVVVLAAFPFAVGQLRSEIDRQRLCAAARAFGVVVASRFLTEPCTRCRGREMRLVLVGPDARWVRYRCRSCGQSRRADAALRSADERDASYRRYQAMRAHYDAHRRGRALRIDIVFQARAAVAPARAAVRAPAPARIRRRGLRTTRARARARGWL
jgi:transposase-like protein